MGGPCQSLMDSASAARLPNASLLNFVFRRPSIVATSTQPPLSPQSPTINPPSPVRDLIPLPDRTKSNNRKWIAEP